MLKEDFKRIFSSVYMYISFALGCILIFRPFIEVLLFQQADFGEGSVSQYLSVPLAMSDFTPFAAIICVLPFAESFCEDYTSDFIKSISVRSGRKVYAAARSLSVMLSGGIVMAAIMIVTIFVCYALATGKDTPENVQFMSNTLWYKSGIIFYCGGVFYYLLRIFFAFLFGCIWALAGLVISTFIVNRFATLIIPFVLYQAAWFSLEGNIFNPLYMLRVDYERIPSFGFVFIYQLSMIAVLYVVSAQRVYKRISL